MIKLVISGIWVLAVTLASVYFSLQMSSAKQDGQDQADFFGGLDYVRTDMLSIPAFSEGRVQGYFITRLVYTAEPDVLRTLTLPPHVLITDELYSLLVGNSAIDFTSMETFDVDSFRAVVRDRLNDRLGKKVFHEVLIEQMEFLTKLEIRNNAAQRRLRPAPPPPKE